MHHTTLLIIVGLGMLAAPHATAAKSSTYTNVQTSVQDGGNGNARSSVSVTTIVDGEEVTDLFIESESEDVATTTEVHTESVSSHTKVRIESHADEDAELLKATNPFPQVIEPSQEIEEERLDIKEVVEGVSTVVESEAGEKVTITSTSSQDAEISAEAVSPFAGTVAALVTRLLYYAAFIFS